MSLFLGAFFTMTSYFFIPVILIIIGRKYSLKSIRIIAFANAIFVYLVYAFLYYMSGSGTPNFNACYLWGSSAYFLLKHKLVIESSIKENVSYDNIESVSDNIHTFSSITVKQCKFPYFVFPILLLCFVILSAFVGYYLGVQNNSPTIFSNAYSDGLASGYENGYEKGYTEGYSKGESDAKAKISSTYGYRTGYDEGYKAARLEYFFKN